MPTIQWLIISWDNLRLDRSIVKVVSITLCESIRSKFTVSSFWKM